MQNYKSNGTTVKNTTLYFYESEDLPVKAPADIFTLRKRNAKNTHKLEDVDGFGEVSVRNLFNAIDARREIPIDRFLNSLGIRHVGETTAKVLAAVRSMFAAGRVGDTEALNLPAAGLKSDERGRLWCDEKHRT